MSWIESHIEMGDHPKLYVLMDALNIGKAEAVGLLHLLWHFTMKFAWRDGDLKKFDMVAVARASGWEGDAVLFVESLRKAQFLDGSIIHDWHDFAGRLVQDRLYNEKRRKTYVKLRKTTPKTRLSPAPYPTLPDPTLPTNQLPISPNGENSDPVQASKRETDVQKVVKGWKMLAGLPLEGPESSTWDKIHFPRYARSAKSLLDLFDGLEGALNCMEYVFDEMQRKKLSCTIETVVKHSDLFREKIQRGPQWKSM